MKEPIQSSCTVNRFLLIGLLICSGLSAIGEEVMGGMGTPVDPNTDAGTGGCCDPSALSLAAILTQPGNYTIQGQAGVDFSIANKSATPTSILMITVNSRTGTQDTGLLLVDPMEEATFPAEMLGDASEFYLISLQSFEFSTAKAKGVTAHHLQSHSASTGLNLIEAETEDGVIMTVGVDEKGNCHYPIHGQVIGTYDAMQQQVTMNDGRLLYKR